MRKGLAGVLAQIAPVVSGEAIGVEGPLAGDTNETRATAASVGGGLQPGSTTASERAAPIAVQGRGNRSGI
jgi:hypothetical protein